MRQARNASCTLLFIDFLESGGSDTLSRMGRMRIASLFVIALLCAACANSQPKPVRLTVMTYNVHHGAGMDGKVDLPRIARVIESAHPDLVALQELDVGSDRTAHIDEPAELAKLLHMHVFFGRAMDWMGGQYGDAILSRLPISNRRQFPLPYTTGGKHEPRIAVAVDCSTRAGKVAFVSTHLDQISDHSDRPAQTRALIDALADEYLPVILGGDFNCSPGSEPIAMLEKSWLRVSDNQPSDPSIRAHSKIDHIFVKPPAQFRVIESHVIDDEMASDHRPVVATFELLPSPNNGAASLASSRKAARF